jgi:hypothetical protein
MGARALRSVTLALALDALVVAVVLNLVLACFNLLPAFPMDGGRILRAILVRRYGMVSATRQAARVGRWVALLMALGGLFTSHLMLVLIAAFVYLAGKREEIAVALRYAAAPTVEAGAPPYGQWQRVGPEWQTGGFGPDGSGRVHGTLHVRQTADPREIEAALRRLKEQLRKMEREA